jgi:hypothetical protein
MYGLGATYNSNLTNIAFCLDSLGVKHKVLWNYAEQKLYKVVE